MNKYICRDMGELSIDKVYIFMIEGDQVEYCIGRTKEACLKRAKKEFKDIFEHEKEIFLTQGNQMEKNLLTKGFHCDEVDGTPYVTLEEYRL